MHYYNTETKAVTENKTTQKSTPKHNNQYLTCKKTETPQKNVKLRHDNSDTSLKPCPISGTTQFC